MDGLLAETLVIRELIQAGQVEGMEARLEARQKAFEAFFAGPAQALGDTQALRAWVEEVQRIDADSRQALLTRRGELHQESTQLKRGLRALTAYHAASDLED